MLEINPDYAKAPYELTFIGRDGNPIDSLKVALRFSEEKIADAVAAMHSGDMKKVASMAVPIFLEKPSS